MATKTFTGNDHSALSDTVAAWCWKNRPKTGFNGLKAKANFQEDEKKITLTWSE